MILKWVYQVELACIEVLALFNKQILFNMFKILGSQQCTSHMLIGK